MTPPVVVIGLDACEQALLRRWADEGVLPTLGRLLASGVSGTVRNAAALHGGSAWASFATGLTPAGHGRFCRRQAPRGAYLDRDHRPADVDGEPFWATFANAGRRVAVLDVPHLGPMRAPGLEVVDWITHDPHYEAPLLRPSGLADELARACPRPAADTCETFPHLAERLDEFLGLYRARVAAKVAATLHCAARGPWDFFATVFGEGHCVGHRCWHIHDSTHPMHDPTLRARHGDPVRAIYVELDTAIARILERFPPEATIIVLASHGMGPIYTGENVVLDDLLRCLDRDPPRMRGAVYRWLKRRWYDVPGRLRESAGLAWLRRRGLRRLHHSMLLPDRKRRRFFAIPNDRYAGAVRVNLQGREAAGIVAPGDYAAVVAEIREALLELADVDTGEPFVRELVTPCMDLDGPHREELPDLAIEWRRTRPVRAVASARLGETPLVPFADRSGDHRNEGLFVAVGPGLGPRRLEAPIAIEDFAPTIAAWAGVTLPRVDGRPIPALTAGVPRTTGRA